MYRFLDKMGIEQTNIVILNEINASKLDIILYSLFIVYRPLNSKNYLVQQI